MEIAQKTDVNIGFTTRFALSRSLGMGRLKSFVVSVKLIGKDRKKITQFFVDSLHKVVASQEYESLGNRQQMLNWKKNSQEFSNHINEKFTEIITNKDKYPQLQSDKSWQYQFENAQAGNIQKDMLNTKKDSDLANNVAVGFIRQELGTRNLDYKDGKFTLSDKDDAKRIADVVQYANARFPRFPTDDEAFNVELRNLYVQDAALKSLRDFKTNFLKKLGAEI